MADIGKIEEQIKALQPKAATLNPDEMSDLDDLEKNLRAMADMLQFKRYIKKILYFAEKKSASKLERKKRSRLTEIFKSRLRHSKSTQNSTSVEAQQISMDRGATC